MNFDLDSGGMDVCVSLDEMGSDNGCEKFWWCDRVLLGHYVDRLLHRIGGYDHFVVGFGIAV